MTKLSPVRYWFPILQGYPAEIVWDSETAQKEYLAVCGKEGMPWFRSEENGQDYFFGQIEYEGEAPW